MDPNLREYIRAGLAHNIPAQQLGEDLIASGWDVHSVDDAFSHYGKESSEPPPVIESVLPKAKKRFVLPALVAGLLILVLAVGTAVVFAEQGYLPSFSRLYRKTPLPFLWGSKTANPAYATLLAIQSVKTAPTIRENTVYSLNVSAKDATTPVSLKALDDVRQLAAIPAGTTSHGFNDSPLNYLPFTMQLTSLSERDTHDNYHVSVNLDLGENFLKIPLLKLYLPNIQQKNTAEGSLDQASRTAYLRSSTIPYLTPADFNKWLAFAIPSDILKKINESVREQKTISKSDSETYRKILGRIITDDGIIRRDNKPYARYRIAISPSTFSSLKLPSGYADYLTQVARSNLGIHGTVWLEPRTARLAFSEFSTEFTPDKSGIMVSVSAKTSLRYDSSTDVIAPPTGEVIVDGEGYFGKVVKKSVKAAVLSPSLSAASQGYLNPKRRADIVSLGKAMEIYLANDSTGRHPPSTNGKAQRLDTTANVLYNLRDSLNITLPIKDPQPEQYYYSYSSDGNHYEFTCVITAVGDSSKIASLYKVKDGSIIEVPFNK
jgi:hypothetical protein